MNAVAQVAIGNSHYVMGGDALWSTEILGFQFSFTPGLTTWKMCIRDRARRCRLGAGVSGDGFMKIKVVG